MPQVLTRLIGVIATDAPIGEWFDAPMRGDCRNSFENTHRLTPRWSRKRADERDGDEDESRVISANMKQLDLDLQESYAQVIEIISEGRGSHVRHFQRRR